MQGQLESVRVLVEADAQEDAEPGRNNDRKEGRQDSPGDGNDIIGGTRRDNEGGNTFGDSVSSLGEAHQAGDDDSRGNRGQDEAEHEADGPREAQDEVGEASNCRRLHEAGDEGGADDLDVIVNALSDLILPSRRDATTERDRVRDLLEGESLPSKVCEDLATGSDPIRARCSEGDTRPGFSLSDAPRDPPGCAGREGSQQRMH